MWSLSVIVMLRSLCHTASLFFFSVAFFSHIPTMVQINTNYSTLECCLCLETFKALEVRDAASSSTKAPPVVIQPLYAPDGCMHFICRPCLESYFKSVVNRTPADRVICPSPDCESVYDPGQTVLLAFQDEYDAFSWWRSVLLRCFIPENRVNMLSLHHL